MREFYRAYESDLTIMTEAMAIGWTQNMVILEADLTLQERMWYIQATGQFGWSKLELQRKIAANAHQEIALDFADDVCYTEEKSTRVGCAVDGEPSFNLPREHLPQSDGRVCDEGSGKESRSVGAVPDRVSRDQPCGWGGLSTGPAETGRAWDQLPGQNFPPAHARNFMILHQLVCVRFIGSCLKISK